MQHAQQLKEHTLKVTPQRIAILEEIEKAGHIDVDRLFEILRGRFAHISLATVYKNVNHLYEKDILAVIKVAKHKLKYEIAKEPHIHLTCYECGSVQDMQQCLNQLLNSAEGESGYLLEHSTVVLNGICPGCQTKTA
jgi:Fur family ferric uptake transcriptional regulator/Fur family peroxide stress response transcriptional regulator